MAAASLGLLACGAVPGGHAGSSTSSLHDRPVRLPAIVHGATCPVSPRITVPPAGGVKKMVPGYAFGRGPAYLSGQINWYAGAPGQEALVLMDGTYTGPILIRARSLDGSGSITLDVQSTPLGVTAVVPPGTATGDGVEAAVPAGTSGWSSWLGRLTASASGCYGIQVDGTSFTSAIVFAVRPGPIPPG